MIDAILEFLKPFNGFITITLFEDNNSYRLVSTGTFEKDQFIREFCNTDFSLKKISPTGLVHFTLEKQPFILDVKNFEPETKIDFGL